MKVSEFIEWLKMQDQDATVEVLCRVRATGYGGESSKKEEFDPQEHVDYMDFRGNKWVKDDAPHKDRRFLFLGLQ